LVKPVLRVFGRPGDQATKDYILDISKIHLAEMNMLSSKAILAPYRRNARCIARGGDHLPSTFLQLRKRSQGIRCLSSNANNEALFLPKDAKTVYEGPYSKTFKYLKYVSTRRMLFRNALLNSPNTRIIGSSPYRLWVSRQPCLPSSSSWSRHCRHLGGSFSRSPPSLYDLDIWNSRPHC